MLRAVSGMKCMRVISQAKRITHDIARAEAGVDTSVISSHVQQTCAAMASAGDYEVRDSCGGHACYVGLTSRGNAKCGVCCV